MTPNHPQRIILASGSASRRQMLSAAGIAFAVTPSAVDESALRRQMENVPGRLDPGVLALALARAKAEDVSAREHAALVIGGDQVLALGDRIYEKPRDMAEARRHLTEFRGATHVLHSAAALAIGGRAVWSIAASARMTMRPFSNAFLDDYLARAGPVVCTSVGAYQLEGAGIQLFENIDGDYFTNLGLPLLPLLAVLRTRKALVT